MNICLRCGEAFEEPTLMSHVVGKWQEEAYTEPVCTCPNCGGDELETAKQCKHCDTWCFHDDLQGGFCKKCIEDFSQTLSLCLKFINEPDDNGDTLEREFYVNKFMACDCTTASRALIDLCKQDYTAQLCTPQNYAHLSQLATVFCMERLSDFTEFLEVENG